MSRRVAVIDTGTNSTRLLVADIEDRRLKELARHSEITRLGEGVDSTAVLSEAAMARVRAVFAGYQKITSDLEADDRFILATSSVRDAANGEDFIAGLARHAAFEYRILEGRQEAELSFTGAILDTSSSERVMLVDVGGGSTEVVVGGIGEIRYVASMNLGCVRLTEKLFGGGRIDASAIASATGYIDERLRSELDRAELADTSKAVAVAGSATSLAAYDLGLSVYDRAKVHGHRLVRDRLDQMLFALAGMTMKQRLKISILQTGRADVIVAGALLLQRIMDYAGLSELVVSEKDILDGAAMWIVEHRL